MAGRAKTRSLRSGPGWFQDPQVAVLEKKLGTRHAMIQDLKQESSASMATADMHGYNTCETGIQLIVKVGIMVDQELQGKTRGNEN